MNTLDLNQLAIFMRVVDEGSFTAAGKALNVPKSRISRMVADLENNLGCAYCSALHAKSA